MLSPNAALRRDGPYAFHERALKRWSTGRLSFEPQSDGGLLARFRFDGNTCNNMGLPLAFNYWVRLASPDKEYRILDSGCEAVDDLPGNQRMCAPDPDEIDRALAEERPLIGRPLDEALDWSPKSSPSACLCTQASRNHKWRIVLQTIHFGLVKE